MINVGKEPGENWTPLEALGVAMRALEKAEERTNVGFNTNGYDVKRDSFAKMREELANGFVEEGTKGLKS